MTTTWPLALVAFAAAVGKALALKASRRSAVRQHVPYGCLLLLFCVGPSVCAKVFATFRCDDFGFDDAAPSGRRRRFLVADMSIRCPDDSGEPTPEYDRLAAYAYTMVAVWPVGMPMADWRSPSR